MAVVQPWSCSGDVHTEGLGRMQPLLPVQRVLDAVVELVAAVTREMGHLSQQAKGQPRLKMEPVQAGQISSKGCGAFQRLNAVGSQGVQLLTPFFFKALGQHSNGWKPVLTPARLCSRSRLLPEWQRPVLGLGDPHQCFGQRFDSAQLHHEPRGCNGLDGA